MSTLVMIDGQVFSEDQAKISVFDRGFLYGDAVFETVRTYRGVPFLLDEHLARLAWSAGRVFIDLPVPMSALAEEITELLAQANNSESYVRIMVTRGRGPLGLDPGLAEQATRVIIVGPLHTPPQQAYDDGVAVVSFKTQRLSDATDAAGAKISNYLTAVLGMREARRASAHEALIVDAHDHVVEGTSSNVFAVVGGRVLTPPEDAGILPGLTRARVIELAASAGLPVQYRALAVAELARADEVFISSTIREILPVVRIDALGIGNGRPGPVARELLRLFRESVRN